MAAHTVNKLTAIFVKKAKEPGKYGDGNGLFLHVKLSGAKHWVQRLTVNGKRRDIGLGSASIFSLEDARTAARDNKRIARLGGDPLAEKYKKQGR
ncbi:Arm DNA-binding domain-containing protein [Alphaproteobacteria bacterium]|nr:Arm DNA-binding domain-containing protein [Alphaproteobacteria bacterium]